jgi:hypothetical protein
MSFIYRDPLIPAVATWCSASKVYHTFKKVWPVADDITYGEKLPFYYGGAYQESKKLSRFLAALGTSWEEVSKEKVDDEIESVWFKINPEYDWDGSFAGDSRVNPGRSTKATTQLVAPTAQELVDRFNEAFDIDEELEVRVHYGGTRNRYIGAHELQWAINAAGVVESQPLNTDKIREVIESDPWYYLANIQYEGFKRDSNQFQLYDGANIDVPGKTSLKPTSRFVGASNVTVHIDGYVPAPGLDKGYELGIFAMMASSSEFEPIEGSETAIGTGESMREDGAAISFVYSRKFKYKGIKTNSKLISDMLKYYDQKSVWKLNRRPVLTPVGQYKSYLSKMTKDTVYKRVLHDLQQYADPYTGVTTREVSNSLFYNGRLRIYESRMMRRKDFMVMLAQGLDVDYAVEKAKWWEKVLFVVIIIAAVIVGIMTGGTGFAAMATGLGNSAMVLAVGGMILSTFGGLSAQGLVEIIGKVAQIVGIAAVAAGIMAAIQNAGKVAAENALKESGATVTDEAVKAIMDTQTLVDQVSALIDQSLSKISEQLTSSLDFITDFTFENVMKAVDAISDGLNMITKVMSMYQDKEQAKLASEYEVLEKEQAQYNADILTRALTHPGAISTAMDSRIYGWDAIEEQTIVLENKIGGDNSFNIWYGDVNNI